MVEVTSIYGTSIWVRITPDADFKNNGYYYEVYRDENGDSDPIDFGCTYDQSYDRSLDYACDMAERLDYNPYTPQRWTEIKAINKWFYFSMNYESDFIKKCWSDKPNLASHLQGKFDDYYERYGSDAVMNVFYAALDWGNRKRLLDWVLTNYNDEQKVPY